ncbi:MAG TPA: hypothetical protein PKM73_15840 [Verrucomicrobiota bacterium]|nr:hypothetical protein [Verrucomicrobiota bacterium]
MTTSRPRMFSVAAWLALGVHTACAQLPRYTAEVQPDLSSHDGKLRWAVGVQNVQVIRSAANNPSLADGHDTIYRHHQFLAYWGGLFWVMHDGAASRLAWSTNGLDWSPAVSSPIFDGGHHRMAFYVAPNGRFLASHYRGTRNGGMGVRLVREIGGPDSYGPIYNVKTNHLGPGPYVHWPWYASSPDSGFVAACDALRNDPLVRQQWQEEDQDPVFYTVSTNGGNRVWKAFCWYRLPDQRIVGFWKNHYMAVSTGSDWIPDHVPDPTQVKSFRWHPGAKVWGERTSDGRYALIGCASHGDGQRRWPLAAAISEDGLHFNTPFLVIAGDMPPQRYENDPGDDKNCGPQYVRGITPGNGDPPGTDLWLTYSMNKEDIWVASVPTPIVGQVTNDVRDDFQAQSPGRRVEGWNTYSPQWAPVAVVAEGTNRFVRLEDRDPYDYASVMRVFPQHTLAHLSFQVRAHQKSTTSAPLEIDVVSSNGTRAVAIALNGGKITAWNGTTEEEDVCQYAPNEWIRLDLLVDGNRQVYTLRVDGVDVLTNASFRDATPTVERLVFRTGEFRLRDFSRRRHTEPFLTTRLPNADVPEPSRQFDIDNVALFRMASDELRMSSPPGAGNTAVMFNTTGGQKARVSR